MNSDRELGTNGELVKYCFRYPSAEISNDTPCVNPRVLYNV